MQLEELRAQAQAAEAAAHKALEAAQQAMELVRQVQKQLASSKHATDDTTEETHSMSSQEEQSPVKEVKKRKKEESDSDSDSSSSDDDDSSDDEEEDAKPTTPAPVVQKAPTAASKDDDSSSGSSSDSSSSESEDEGEEKVVEQKEASELKAAAAKDGDSSSSSDDSSSDESEDEDEEKKAPETPSPNKRSFSENQESEGPPSKRTAAADDVDGNTKIYVRGLPWKASDSEVHDLFASCGEIVSCELPLLDDGRSSGTAIVQFKATEAAATALEMNGSDYQGRWLSIKYSTPKPILSPREPTKKEEGCCTVFIGNLAWDIDEDTLRQAFAECGDIKMVRFATDRETGDFKGFGHIEFYETDATDKAVAMAGTDVMGRQIRVDFANDRKNNNGGGGRFGGGGGRGFGGGGGGRGGGGWNRGQQQGGRQFGDRGGGRWGGGGRGGSNAGTDTRAKKNGAIANFSGSKITFDD